MVHDEKSQYFSMKMKKFMTNVHDGVHDAPKMNPVRFTVRSAALSPGVARRTKNVAVAKTAHKLAPSHVASICIGVRTHETQMCGTDTMNYI